MGVLLVDGKIEVGIYMLQNWKTNASSTSMEKGALIEDRV